MPPKRKAGPKAAKAATVPKTPAIPVPADAEQGAGQLHAAFTPLPPEVNIPKAADDDMYAPFESDIDVWQFDEDEIAANEGVGDDEETASWADSRGAYDDGLDGVDGVELAGSSVPRNDDEFDVALDLLGASPVEAEDPLAVFMSRRRQRTPKELRGVYSGPQLIMDASTSDDEEHPGECVRFPSNLSFPRVHGEALERQEGAQGQGRGD